MRHSPASIDDLIREGTSLKHRLGMLVRQLELGWDDLHGIQLDVPGRPQRSSGPDNRHIKFISPLPGGLKSAMTGIFSLVCSFDGVEHGGIYVFDKAQRHLDLVCHYNLNEELLARAITCDQGSWQVRTVLDGQSGPVGMQHIPLHALISYERSGIRAVVLFPLVHRGKVLGCIHLASRKEDFISGFEKVVLDGITLRVARTVALHLAQLRLNEANEVLNRLLVSIAKSVGRVVHPSATDPLHGFFAGMKNEIGGLARAIAMATAKIMQKLESGHRNRELPFMEKKVDGMLHDIDLVTRLICRLRVFCASQYPILECGIPAFYNPADKLFVDSMMEFYKALEALVAEDKKQRPVTGSYIGSQFEPLSWPVRLSDVKTRTDRLLQN